MKEPDEYYAGKGCTCYAYSESECCCDVDWTDPEVYELRGRVKRLEVTLQKYAKYANKEAMERDIKLIGEVL